MYFYIITGIFVVIGFFLQKKYQLFSIFYNKDKLAHNLLLKSTCLFFVLLSVLFYFYILNPKNTDVYPLKRPVYTYSPYIQQFDAFQKGQLHIDFMPQSDLLELENPYDPAQREGLFYLWDRALYNGKYYSYFGIAPVITVYYPYYYITGELPSDSFVILIYLIISSIFIPLTIIEGLRYTRKIPLSVIILGIMATTFGSNIFLLSRGWVPFYYIAVLSATAFLSMFFFFFLRAFRSKGKSRLLYYFLAGVAYSLTFLSRLNVALLAVFLIIPALWFYIFRRDDETRIFKKLSSELVALGIPVVLTLLFTFWYNNARFSSPFDFGTNYQLTVSDVSLNKVRLGDIPYVIHHYFLQGYQSSANFPYITMPNTSFEDYGHYVYIDANFGLLNIPLMLALFLLPVVLIKFDILTRFKVLISSSVIGIFIVAWLNFSMGGVIFRYVSDLTLIASLTSVFIIFLLYETFGINKNHYRFYKYANPVLSFFLMISIIICIRISLIDNINLIKINNTIINYLKLFLPF